MLRTTALLLVSLGLVASLMLAPAASAKVSRTAGGSAESVAYCHSATRKIEVQSWVYQDYGGPQGIGAQVLLLNTAANQWYDAGSQTTTTQNVYGVTGSVAKFARTIVVPRAPHAVWVRYWWNTNRGWQYLEERLGYCNF